MALIKQTPTVIMPFGIGNNRNAETLFRRIQDKTGMATYPFTRGGVGFGVKNVVDDTNRLVAVGANKPAVQFEAGVNKGLWIEPEATNLLAPSNDLTSLSWVKTGATISANSSLAPDGTMTADKLVEDTSTGVHRISYSFLNFPNAIVRAISFYVKPAGRTAINVISSSSAIVLCRATFTLTGDGVATGEEAIGIEKAGDYYKCKVRADRVSNNPHSIHFSLSNGSSTSYTGDGSSGAFITDLQIEDGSVATSSIKTEGSTVTRPADVATITDASDLIGQEQGTILVEVDVTSAGGDSANGILTITSEIGPDDNNRILIAKDINAKRFVFQIRQNNTNLFNIATPADWIDGVNKIGFVYSNGRNALFVNGVKITENTLIPAFSSTLSVIKLGYYSGVNGNLYINDFISIPIILKQALSDTEVQNWTTL